MFVLLLMLLFFLLLVLLFLFLLLVLLLLLNVVRVCDSNFYACIMFQLVNELQEQCSSFQEARNTLQEDVERLNEVIKA